MARAPSGDASIRSWCPSIVSPKYLVANRRLSATLPAGVNRGGIEAIQPVKRRITTLMASGFLASASSAMAGPLEDAHAAYRRDDYATAMSLWSPLADQGDTVAQRNLGLMSHQRPRRAAGLCSGSHVVKLGGLWP